MLPDVENLIALEQADREILRLKEEIAALPKRVAAIEQKLAGTKAALEKAKAAIKADEAARRKYETAIQDLQGKISKYRDQSLEVKTNEQYKALLHEIQFAEQDIRGNEDKILELMIDAETQEKEVKTAEVELKEETAEIEKEKEEARQRTAEDEKLLADWNAKRDKARSAVSAELLQHYDRVSKYRGSGIAEVRDHKCMGCQVMLRPQTFNEVRTGVVVMCDSCQRVLYFDPATEQSIEWSSSVTRHRVGRKTRVDKAWFYRPDFGIAGEVFLAFVNAKGSSSRRVYDAKTGRKIGKTERREDIDFEVGFPEDLKTATQLNSGLNEQQLEAWAEELPTGIFDELHNELRTAGAVIRAAGTHRRRPHPKLDASRAWYYRSDYDAAGEVFLSYINADGNSSRRVYDVHTGRKLEDTLVREGEYRLGFPEDLPAAIRLNGNWSEEELDEWGDELPTVVLDILQRDLNLARTEAANKSQAHAKSAEAAQSEHSAAS
jgi:predicted  nucleic acid-binding Zn-ribbon protein